MKCAKCGKPCNDARTKPAVCFECASGKKKECALSKVAAAPSLQELGAVLGGTVGGYALGDSAQAVLAGQLRNAAKRMSKTENAELRATLKKKSKDVGSSNLGGLLGAASGGIGAMSGVAHARQQAHSDKVNGALATALGIGGVGALTANVALTNSVRNAQKQKHAALSSGAVRASASGLGGGAIGGVVGALLSGAKNTSEVARAAALTGIASGASVLAANTAHNAVQRARHRRFLKRVGLGAGVAGAAGLGGLYYHKRNQGLLEKRATWNPFSIWRGVTRTGVAAGLGAGVVGAGQELFRLARAAAPTAVGDSAAAVRAAKANYERVARAAQQDTRAATSSRAGRTVRVANHSAHADRLGRKAAEARALLAPERIAAVEAAAKAGPAHGFTDVNEIAMFKALRGQAKHVAKAEKAKALTGSPVDQVKQVVQKIPGMGPDVNAAREQVSGVVRAQRERTRAALSPLKDARGELKTAQEMSDFKDLHGGTPSLGAYAAKFGPQVMSNAAKFAVPAAAGAAALHTGANAWNRRQMINTAKKWALPVGAGVGAYTLLKD
jgi:hypothetical protein